MRLCSSSRKHLVLQATKKSTTKKCWVVRGQPPTLPYQPSLPALGIVVRLLLLLVLSLRVRHLPTLRRRGSMQLLLLIVLVRLLVLVMCWALSALQRTQVSLPPKHDALKRTSKALPQLFPRSLPSRTPQRRCSRNHRDPLKGGGRPTMMMMMTMIDEFFWGFGHCHDRHKTTGVARSACKLCRGGDASGDHRPGWGRQRRPDGS